MRPVGGASAHWLGRPVELDDAADAAVDAAIARGALDIEDGVEPGAPIDAGTDAVATAGGRGRATARARALFSALAEARDGLPPVERELGAFTDALVRARAQVEGDLGAVLDKYIAMRRRVAAGVGSISSG